MREHEPTLDSLQTELADIEQKITRLDAENQRDTAEYNTLWKRKEEIENEINSLENQQQAA